MPNFPVPLNSTPGERPGEGEGRLINVSVEREGDTTYWRRTPGLVLFTTIGGPAPRGVAEINNSLYVVVGTAVVKVAADGTYSVLSGSVPGSEGVTIARNNKVPTPDIVITRTGGGSYIVSSGAVSAYPDADLPALANSVSILGPFLTWTVGDGRIFCSDVNTTDVSALSFSTAESSPDGLVRGFVHGGRFYACGTRTIEVWQNQGLTPFPLGRYPTVMQVGLLRPMAVAGFEEGWDGLPIFVARDGTVRELQGGFTAAPISTRDVERFIGKSDPESLEACIYVTSGRGVWALSSNLGTWEFATSSRTWRERVSTATNRSRISKSAKLGDRWIVGDTLGGVLGEVTDTVRTEYGAPVAWTVETGGLKNYPARVNMASGAFADFTKAEAEVAFSWSQDGGQTWAIPQAHSLATCDRYPLVQRRIGQSTQHGTRLRLSTSTAADFSFQGATVPSPNVRAP